ncbi:MAG: hypothetical protein MI717_02855 [Spirochaetales bacterium]|nr:hypothetical protein [Spirochaetales bacterium]
MKQITIYIVTSFLLSALFISCDMGPVKLAGELVNPYPALGEYESYMAVVGDDDQELRILSLETSAGFAKDATGKYCLFTLKNQQDGDVWTMPVSLTRGNFTVGDGTIELAQVVEYKGKYGGTFDVNTNDFIKNATAKTLPSTNFALSASKDSLKFNSANYKRMDLVLDQVFNEKSQDQLATSIFKLYQISMYTSQIMVEGFGSVSMNSYRDKTTKFESPLSGDMQMRLEMDWATFRSKTSFIFNQVVNFKGLMINQSYLSDSAFNGDGTLSGTIELSLATELGYNTACNVTLRYTNLAVKGAIPSSGSYEVEIGRNPVSVSYGAMNPSESLNFSDFK